MNSLSLTVLFLLPTNLFLLASEFFSVKKSLRILPTVIVICLTTIVYSLIRTTIFSDKGDTLLAVIFKTFLSIGYGIILLHFFQESDLSKRQFYLFYAGLITIVEELIWVLTTKSFDFIIIGENWTYELVNFLVCFTFVFLKWLKRGSQATSIPIFFLQFLIVASCFISLFVFFNDWNLFIVICLSIMIFLFYCYFNYSNSLHQSVHKSQLINQKYMLMEEHYQRLNHYHEDMKQVNNEMREQLRKLQGSMGEGNVLQAKIQLECMIRDYTKIGNPKITQHKAMNILLSHKYHQAQIKSVDCQFEIKLSADVSIEDKDLISLVGNLLDNAIEACNYCLPENRWIRFKLILQQRCLVVQCENSIDAVHKSFKTRKKEQWKHGLGMKSIQQIVKKYNGTIEHQWKTASFFIELNLLENLS